MGGEGGLLPGGQHLTHAGEEGGQGIQARAGVEGGHGGHGLHQCCCQWEAGDILEGK